MHTTNADRLSKLGRYELKLESDRFPVMRGADEWHLDFLISHAGQVLWCDIDDESGDGGAVVGTFSGYTILACPAEQARVDIIADVCDALDQDIYEVAHAVYEPGNGAHFRAEHELREHWGGNVLYLESLELDEAHRGFGLGLEVLRALIRRFGEDRRLVVMKPFPLQFANKVTDDNRAEVEAGTAKLRDYYAQLGFVPLKGQPEYMVLDLIVGMADEDAAE